MEKMLFNDYDLLNACCMEYISTENVSTETEFKKYINSISKVPGQNIYANMKSSLQAELDQILKQQMNLKLRLDISQEALHKEKAQTKIMVGKNDELRGCLASCLDMLPETFKKDVQMKLQYSNVNYNTSSMYNNRVAAIHLDENNNEYDNDNHKTVVPEISTSSIQLPTIIEENKINDDDESITLQSNNTTFTVGDYDFSVIGKISTSTEVDVNGDQVFSVIMDVINSHNHEPNKKRIVMGKKCNVCYSNVLCGSMAYLCENCKSITHERCINNLSSTCISMPKIAVPVKENEPISIENYCTPSFKLQIPSIVIHCVIEIEKRGLNVIDLYIQPPKEPDETYTIYETAKRWCFKGTGIPSFSNMNIHYVCLLLKEFLSSISPLIAAKEFSLMLDNYNEANEAHLSKSKQITTVVYNSLLHINSVSRRNTFLFMIFHLRRIVNAPNCHTSAAELSRLFTPIFVENYNTLTTVDQQAKYCSFLEDMLKLETIQWQTIFMKFI